MLLYATGIDVAYSVLGDRSRSDPFSMYMCLFKSIFVINIFDGSTSSKFPHEGLTFLADFARTSLPRKIPIAHYNYN
jgi:hypothetical protein